MITYPVSTKNAAIITGISPQALRTYTRRYSRFLSLEATPDAGQERRFTEADLRTLKFAYSVTATGRPHEEAIARLQAGELDSYPWSRNLASALAIPSSSCRLESLIAIHGHRRRPTLQYPLQTPQRPPAGSWCH